MKVSSAQFDEQVRELDRKVNSKELTYENAYYELLIHCGLMVAQLGDYEKNDLVQINRG